MESNSKLLNFIDRVILALGIIYFFFFPLLFLDITSEFFTYSKIVLTIGIAALLTLLWVLKALVKNSFMVAKTRLDLPVLLILVSFAVSTYFSRSPFTSVFGSFNNWHATLFEIAGFIMIMYALVSNLSGWGAIKKLTLSFFTSAFFVALSGLLVYFDVFDGRSLPVPFKMFEVFQVNGFSPAGNVPSVIVLLLAAIFVGSFMLRYAVIHLKNDNKGAGSNVWSIVTIGAMLLPMIVTLFLWLGVYVPGFESRNPDFQQLNFSSSWKIAVSSIREYPFWGTGPSTYSAAYSAFKPIELNSTDLWNIVFHQSGSEYLTWLTTVGIIGFIAIVLFAFKSFSAGINSIKHAPELGKKLHSDTNQQLVSSFLYPVVLTVLGILLMFLFTSSTTTTMGVLFMFLIIWFLIEKLWREEIVEEVIFDVRAIKSGIFRRDDKNVKTAGFSYMPLIVGVPMVLLSGLVLFFTVQDFRSNIAFTDAQKKILQNAPVGEIYDLQQQAIRLNPRRDAYRLAYGNTNISLAEVLAAQNSETLDETTRSDILALIQQSIREVTVATEVINEASVINWQSRGNLYRRLIGVVNGAEQSSLEAYQIASNLSPTSPVLLANIANLFYTLATNVELVHAEQLEQADNPEELLQNLKNNYFTQADVAYRSAINLKSDYIDGYSGLAQVYIDAGANDLAVEQLKTVLRLLPQDNENREQIQKLIDELSVPSPTPTPFPQIEE